MARTWMVAMLLMCGAVLAIPWACSAKEGPPGPPRVVVSLAPLAGIARALLPEGANVDLLIPPGASEHGYDIPPSKLASLAGADMVVYVGLGLEPQVEKYVKDHPRAERRDVGFAASVGMGAAADEKHDDHAHHEDHDHAHHDDHDHGDHGHGGTDPHLWLDPVLVRKFVPVLAEAIIALRREGPQTAANVNARRDRLIGQIDELDRAYAAMVKAAPRKTLVVGHDAYGHLAARYGLTTLAIAGLSASEPTPSAIAAVSAAARDEGATTVFIEPQLSAAVASRIASACKLKVCVLDPLGDGDWMLMMRKNLTEIGEALGAPATEPAAEPSGAK